MRVRAILLAAALALAPLGARAADLVVWWEQGFSPEEDEATREMMAAFEHETGTTVVDRLPRANREKVGTLMPI
jgi:ABC-type glycerol-3-phosphate transport system substrate-binding protein